MNDEGGFTLVEVLVALALFSLLVSSVFESVRFGLRAWQTSSSRSEQFEQTLVAQRLVRRLVEHAYPKYVPQSAGTAASIEFEGAKDRLTLLGDAPQVFGAGSRFKFLFSVETQDGKNDLVLSSVPELARSPERSQYKTVLLSDVERVQFAYFGAPLPGRAGQWHEAWLNNISLPTLVRVTVSLRDGDKRSWPDLVIRPHVGADVSCAYDQLTMRCRGR